MPDLLRIETNERVDYEDFDYLANLGMDAHARNVMERFLTNPTGSQKSWIVSGFAIDVPSGTQVRVTRGVAILPRLEGAQIIYGMVTAEGDATKTVDISAYPAGTYSIYIRFDYVEADSENRVFWNSAGTGTEYTQTISSRRQASWSLRVEASSPGDEWFLIGQVVRGTMALTDLRSFYFEGAVATTYANTWGAGNDRNANRKLYGVRDLQTFVAAMRTCLEDVKGRGLRRWWDPSIGGLNVGFADDPVEDRIACYDANTYLFASDTMGVLRLTSGVFIDAAKGVDALGVSMGGEYRILLNSLGWIDIGGGESPTVPFLIDEFASATLEDAATSEVILNVIRNKTTTSYTALSLRSRRDYVGSDPAGQSWYWVREDDDIHQCWMRFSGEDVGTAGFPHVGFGFGNIGGGAAFEVLSNKARTQGVVPQLSNTYDIGASGTYYAKAYVGVYYGKTTTITSFDAYDDLALVDAYKPSNEVAEMFLGDESRVVSLGDRAAIPWPMLGPKDETGEHAVNIGGSLFFLLGAVKQLHAKHQQEVGVLRARLAELLGEPEEALSLPAPARPSRNLAIVQAFEKAAEEAPNAPLVYLKDASVKALDMPTEERPLILFGAAKHEELSHEEAVNGNWLGIALHQSLLGKLPLRGAFTGDYVHPIRSYVQRALVLGIPVWSGRVGSRT